MTKNTLKWSTIYRHKRNTGRQQKPICDRTNTGKLSGAMSGHIHAPKAVRQTNQCPKMPSKLTIASKDRTCHPAIFSFLAHPPVVQSLQRTNYIEDYNTKLTCIAIFYHIKILFRNYMYFCNKIYFLCYLLDVDLTCNHLAYIGYQIKFF